MYRVLLAIANTVKEVGYIQGLNSIAAIALMHLREEDAYWMTTYLLKKKELKSLIGLQFKLLNQWSFQLKCCMQYYMSDIYDYIVNFRFSSPFLIDHSNKMSKGLTLEYYTTPWFLTLFSDYFQPSVVKE